MFKNKAVKNYIKWMAINSWATSTSSVISTNSMLNSIMTTPSYTSIIATTYIGKDILGQLGGLIYAYKTGKHADKNPLNYVSKGVFLGQLSFYLENFSPLISNKNLILPFLGLSSCLKNVSFISIGAVNANNLQKISNQNIGEVYTKVASINTLASTGGMITGIAIINFLPSYTVRTFLIMPILTFISLYSLRKSTTIANNF